MPPCWHLQYNEGDEKCAPVEESSPAVDALRLFLVHSTPAVSTAPAARKTESDEGHEDDVNNPNSQANQETFLIGQCLQTPPDSDGENVLKTITK